MSSPAVGTRFPAFTLPDHLSRPFDIAEAARAKPQVVVFYRGDW